MSSFGTKSSHGKFTMVPSSDWEYLISMQGNSKVEGHCQKA
jgi:hypothetical protein